MRLRRARFATPFVVVLGCGQPAKPPPVDPGAEPTGEQVVVAPLPDASVPPPLDATVTPPDAAPGVRVIGRIIQVVVTDAGMSVTANRGTHHGVQKGWRAQLLDTNGRPLSGGDYVISSVRATSCAGTLHRTMDFIRNSRDVELRPPPP